MRYKATQDKGKYTNGQWPPPASQCSDETLTAVHGGPMRYKTSQYNRRCTEGLWPQPVSQCSDKALVAVQGGQTRCKTILDKRRQCKIHKCDIKQFKINEDNTRSAIQNKYKRRDPNGLWPPPVSQRSDKALFAVQGGPMRCKTIQDTQGQCKILKFDITQFNTNEDNSK